ncbi:MAG: hypothetical protein ACJ735_13005 [Actinomycetes bacterium]
MADNDTDGRESDVQDAENVDHGAAEGGPIPGRDGGPEDADAMAAAEGLEASPETAKNYEDMLERGAAQQGEGRVP